MNRLARHRALIGLLVVIAAVLVLVAVARPSVGWDPSEYAAQPAASQPNPRPEPEPEPTPEPGPDATSASGSAPASFGTKPIRHASEVEAELVDVEASTGDGVENVTFRFAHGTKLPHYTVAYTDAVRLYPDEPPIPVLGNAYLKVTFDRTDPNQANRLAFPPSIQVGQPQVAEVLLYDNLAGSLRFAVGVNQKAKFRVRTLSEPLRMVVQIRTP